jgi:hypothetical protein
MLNIVITNRETGEEVTVEGCAKLHGINTDTYNKQYIAFYQDAVIVEAFEKSTHTEARRFDQQRFTLSITNTGK